MAWEAGKRWFFMGWLASLITYLGAATGIVVALLMAVTVFLAAADQPTITPQKSAIVSSPRKFAATKDATPRVTAGIGHWKPSGTSGIIREGVLDLQMKSLAYARSRVTRANQTWRKKFLYMFSWRERTRHLAFQQQTSDFESRFMGYVDDPSADPSLIR
jgi:hypothetical protein